MSSSTKLRVWVETKRWSSSATMRPTLLEVSTVPEMGELKHHVNDSRYQKQDDYSIVDVGTEFCLFHKAVL